MASVYILYSKSLEKFYVGSCLHMDERLRQHNNGTFGKSFTAMRNDWELKFEMTNLTYQQARKVELHVKRMKSSEFIRNFIKFPEIQNRLRALYFDF